MKKKKKKKKEKNKKKSKKKKKKLNSRENYASKHKKLKVGKNIDI